MASAQEIVEDALQRIGRHDANASASPADLALGLRVLNRMISGWAADGLATADQSLEAKIVSGDPKVAVESTAKLAVGMLVIGTGIPSGTAIESIDSPTQITLTQPASTTATVTLNFTPLPFDASLEEGVIALLALKLTPYFGMQPDDILLAEAEEGRRRIEAAFLTVPLAQLDLAILRTPSQITRGDE